MKLETFFEKFDQFADAPDAVAKMRELIMWSAFSGAFSAEERNQPMPEEWAVEGAPTLPSIPSSWKWQRGSEVFEVIRGVSYKKNDASDSPVEGSFPVLRANNIGNGINFDGLVYVPRDNIRDEQFVRRGDILIAMSSGSKKLVGKAAPIVSDFVGSFGAFCGIIRNKSAIPDEVLARYFQSPQYTSWVTAAGRGIGINNLGRGDLDSLPVPTPPLAEQKRIVAKVDELMALCDRLERQQQERETRHAALARASLARFADAPTPANLDFLFHPSYAIPPADLRKSILTLAVQGKLVPQDPNDEPAEELLERIRKARHALAENGNVKTKVQLAPIGPDEEPYSIPDTWLWVPLNEVTELVYGKLLPTTELLPEGFQVFGANGIIGRFSKYLYEDEMLLISCRGAYSGTPNISPPKCYVTNNSIVCEFFEPSACDIRFFHSVISISPREKIVTGSAQPQVTVANAIKLPVPLPPLAEQRRIVAKVEQLMALVEALETQLAASRATAANLLSALVAELTAAA